MATTNFTTGTVIAADWLNDVDEHIYGASGHDASEVVVTPAGTIAATDVQAALEELDTEKQPVDATLTSIAALGTAADKMIYTTGVDTWAEASITAAGRALLDDAAASDQRTTLGLAIGTDVLAYVAPGASGNLLTSNGSAWTSAAPGGGGGSTGAIIQVVTAEISYAAGTTTIPDDDTAPAISEGTEIVTANITLADNTNKVKLSASIYAQATAADNSFDPFDGPIIAVFRTVGGVNTCIGTGYGGIVTTSTYTPGLACFSILLMDNPETTSEITYSIRVGGKYKLAGSAAWAVGQRSSAALGDTTDNNIMCLEEVVV